jgi:bifunctional non-homologous end joining protein LigD
MARRRTTRDAAGGRSAHPLSHYWSKRNFSVTTEPAGKEKRPARKSANQGLPFVVQKHAASRLHYDFRLGWDGVLKSWAVAKGPSYYPGDKRLAVMVEDHPWDYRNFEGTIPKGEYGGGTVMVWDTGEWVPHDDVDRGLKDGHLKFELHGEKLKGNWALVRMHGGWGASERNGKTNWLLIKEKDEFARESSDEPITEEEPDSAISGRTMEQIAAAKGSVRSSHSKLRNHAQKKAKARRSRAPSAAAAQKKTKNEIKIDLDRIPREQFPGFIAPQLAQQADAAPSSRDWLHELKLDGYRIQTHVRPEEKNKKRRVQLLTRNGLDWSERMPDIAGAAAGLGVESAILDGEAVALDERGVSNFADLQAAFSEGRQKYITYFAFDLLHLDGHNLRGLPLENRKEILKKVLGRAADSPLQLSEAIDGDGPIVYQKACALGAEGIVSKLASANYTSGRTNTWLKIKCRLEQEFVIGGFTLPSKGAAGVGALLLGYHDGRDLHYAGRVGTGFTQATHRLLRAKLDALAIKQSPFVDVPPPMRRGTHWVKPKLVAQIEFSTWTRGDLVRQAAFKGLREDKPASEVVREHGISLRGSCPDPPKPGKFAQRKRRPRKKEGRGMTELAITHPDKVLDAESGLTKQELADYYAAVAENMLPHISDRPLSIVRCPDGNSKPCFFQKHAGLGLPAGVKSVAIKNRKSGEKEEFLTVNSTEGLVGLAQMGVLEIHPWGSRNESPDKPDRIVFDIDPDAAIEWKTLAATAQKLKKRLSKVELKSFVKTTGGKGLHVVVPIRSDHDWPTIKEFAYQLALDMERAQPDLYVTKMTKATRKNRIYLDYLRNDREATSIAPYSPRARQGAPVAVPLQWMELESSKPPAFHVSDFKKWKKRLSHDPWREMERIRQELKGR